MEIREEKWANLSPLQKAFFKLEQYKERILELEQATTTPRKDIAIVGMAVKFPQADSPEAFWNNLLEKRDHIRPFPDNRKTSAEAYLRVSGQTSGEADFLEGAFLEDIDCFDYSFFNLKPKEAAALHPLQRLFLQTAWRALEDAGSVDIENRGNQIGIYLGTSGEVTYAQYLDMLEKSETSLGPSAYAGNVQAITSSRISYFLDLRGPAVALDTACSSSLVAVHHAIQALHQGDCEVALAGGGRIYLLPEKGKYQIGFESPSGKTRPFDAGADGAGIGEGVAAIVLKPLDQALKDGDRVYAVIKGSAVNQDGASAGITAPNVQAQVEVLQQALKNSDVDPASIRFIEAHGTGTPLGDPVEFQALQEVFSEVAPRGAIALGAVKSNIGHLFEAAGIAGLIKCVLALQKREFPATINHSAANPELNLADSPFTVNTETYRWPEEAGLLRCGVSSFGIGGTNAHVILEEFVSEPKTPEQPSQKIQVFALAAREEESLRTAIHLHLEWLQANPGCSLAQACYSVNRKQSNHLCRFAVAVGSREELIEALRHPDLHLQQNTRSYSLAEDLGEEEIRTQDPFSLAQWYREGAVIDWRLYFKDQKIELVSTPAYPLRSLYCGLSFSEPAARVGEPLAKLPSAELPKTLSYDELFGKLRDMICRETGMEAEELLPEVDFFNLGIDSLVFIKLIQQIHKEFGIKLEINQFFKQLENLHKLTEYLHPELARKPEGEETTSAAAVSVPQTKRIRPEQINYFVPYRKIITKKEDRFSSGQLNHIQELTLRVNQQTQKTKERSQEQRPVLANFRNVVGFRPETKELSYQLIADRAKGSKIYDLDGNEYIDLTMGFGVNLLGYNPDFLQEALQEELKKGFPVGPMAARSGDVAALICEMTGVERVSFYNSGSEAVMFALRLAKASTGRTRYVMFKGSYHGTYDGVLALPDAIDPLASAPMAPGISDQAIADALVLEYGSPDSLAIIREHAHELAAVLVEPVQSRRPDLQPADFLHSLREITEQSGAALIFDEVITGFRIHQGGAQAWFNIKADIVTYGKIVGGGMPIGVVAGKAAFMDAVDGGMWRFGDDSTPDKTTTFVAGTFCEHPLAMRAALENLRYLKQQGNQLQQELNEKNQGLMERLNDYFRRHKLPIQMIYFGSLFRFQLNANWEVFYHHLLANGVYVWEGRNCFLSVAHTEEDLEFIYRAVTQSAQAMIAAGWGESDKPGQSLHQAIPYSEDQENLYSLIRSSAEASVAFNENQVVELQGPLDLQTLQRAITQVVNRHEALRVIQLTDQHFSVANQLSVGILQTNVAHLDPAGLEAFISQKTAEPFLLEQGPFLRFHLFEKAPDHHFLLMTIHHLVADGWSIELIWSEISRLYSSYLKKEATNLPSPYSLAKFNQWHNNGLGQEERLANKAFWSKKFGESYPALVLPTDQPIAGKKGMHGASFSMPIGRSLQQYLGKLASNEKTTLFNLLLTAYNLLLYKLSNQERFILGIPAAGQLQVGESCLVGQCVKMLPFYNRVEPDMKIKDYIAWVRTQLGLIIKHQNTSFADVLNDAEGLRPPLLSTSIDMNAVREKIQFSKLESRISFPPVRFVKFDLSLSIIELDDQLSADFYFNTGLFAEATVRSWAHEYLDLLEEMALQPEKAILDLKVGSAKDVNNIFSSWNNL